MTQQRTIVFFPEGAYGPTNNSVGIADVLRRRGHRVVFIVEESLAGTLEARDFEERLVRLGPGPVREQAPDEFWVDLIRETAPIFRKSTLEQLSEFIAPTWQALIDGAKHADDRVAAIIDELDAHAVVEDNVVSFPALPASGRPWVRIVSCNPAELKDPLVPPFSSGYPASDRTHWGVFIAEVERTHRAMWDDFDAYVRSRGAPALAWHETGPDFNHESPWLNLWLYPEAVDYRRARPLGPTWHRLPSSVRSTDGQWQPPPALRDRGGALIYLSLGSMGSADVTLLQRLVDVLGRSPHRVIVSKGPLADRIRLHHNMAGEAFLPQPSIVPLVDLVITHGGNNTVTEALHHGKPMIVLPLFWDQADNAQRVAETGCGVRLAAYGFRDEELLHAVDALVANEPLRRRLAAMAAGIQAAQGTTRAADLIEQVAVTGEPVHR